MYAQSIEHEYMALYNRMLIIIAEGSDWGEGRGREGGGVGGDNCIDG